MTAQQTHIQIKSVIIQRPEMDDFSSLYVCLEYFVTILNVLVLYPPAAHLHFRIVLGIPFIVATPRLSSHL